MSGFGTSPKMRIISATIKIKITIIRKISKIMIILSK